MFEEEKRLILGPSDHFFDDLEVRHSNFTLHTSNFVNFEMGRIMIRPTITMQRNAEGN